MAPRAPKPHNRKELARRLGRKTFKRRLATEDAREKEFHQFFSPKFTFFKRHIMRPAQIQVLKWIGLHEKGRREFHDVRIVRNEILLPDLPAPFDGFSILQLSDLHIDIDPTLVESIGRAVENVHADLCALTGDYRNLTVGEAEPCVSMMAAVRSHIHMDTYAILGNHDYLCMVEPMEKSGYRFLLNECALFKRNGATLALGGVDDPYIFKTDDIARAFSKAPADAFRVLLAHSPSVYERADAENVRVVLAGHTHGGQICLPNGFILCRNDSCPRRFLRGPWSYGNVRGYTSPGTGGCGLPIRLNCPPEATLHILRKG